MADEIDRAQYLEELSRQQAIDRARMYREAPPEWIDGIPYCHQCGCDYPEARAELGYGSCVECASRHA